MDPSSVITQVSREEERLNVQPENGQVPDARVSKPRSLLRSLLCCLGRRRGSRSPSPSPAPEENGHLSASAGGPARPAVLLPPVTHHDMGRVCLVVDLDETLVHSSFKPINNADFIVPVEIDGHVHQVYVLKRPHVDDFLQKIGQMFECVLFTASLAKYADPVADLLDKWGVFRARLFRESCVYFQGNYVKDLERLGRDLHRVAIVDNSPASYIFHPDNAGLSPIPPEAPASSCFLSWWIPLHVVRSPLLRPPIPLRTPVACKSWFDDMSDTELVDRLPLLEALSRAEDVYSVLGRQRSPSPDSAPGGRGPGPGPGLGLGPPQS